MSAIAAAISAAAALASTLIANNANKKENRRAEAFQTQQIEQQNEYNSPANQMKLMEQAGLNPYLQDGSSLVSNSHQKQVAEAKPTQKQKMDVSEAIGILSQYQQIKKQKLENQGIAYDNTIKKANAEIAKDNLEWKKRSSTAKYEYDWYNYSDPIVALAEQEARHSLALSDEVEQMNKYYALTALQLKHGKQSIMPYYMTKLPANMYEYIAMNNIGRYGKPVVQNWYNEYLPLLPLATKVAPTLSLPHLPLTKWFQKLIHK